VQAQRDAMFLEQREHLVRVPARFAKFDRLTMPARQRLQKRFEAFDLQRPARGQLVEDRSTVSNCLA
jgi:hypothetical protein